MMLMVNLKFRIGKSPGAFNLVILRNDCTLFNSATPYIDFGQRNWQQEIEPA